VHAHARTAAETPFLGVRVVRPSGTRTLRRLQERERADRLTAEIAALARQLASTVDDAAGRERDLQGQLSRAKEEAATSTARVDAMKAELEAIRSKPWWKRLDQMFA
jgi:hypothetical protein